MKKETVYALQYEGKLEGVYGNLKTLVQSIYSERQYSTIHKGLKAGKGKMVFGLYLITRVEIQRATYNKTI